MTIESDGPNIDAADGKGNRGNANSLHEFWAHGKGSALIRWGLPRAR